MRKRDGASYISYANQAFRFYARNESCVELLPLVARIGDGKAVLRIYDWNVCQSILLSFDAKEYAALLDVYRRNGPFRDIVECTAIEHNMSINRLWRLVNKACREFAKVKGMI